VPGRRAHPAAAGLTVALALAVAAAAPGGAHAVAATRVVAGPGACALGWKAPNPGRRTLRLENVAGRRVALTLYHQRTAKVVLRRTVPAHARRTVRLTLDPGTYAWRCAFRGRAPITSDPSRVPIDPVIGRPAGRMSIPVQWDELAGPLAQYRAWGTAQLTAMLAAVRAMQGRLAAGDAGGARAAWLQARLAWERVGAAYGALGASGTAISATAAGLPGGTADPSFTGLHRVELDLFGSGDLAAAARDGAVLEAAVARLTASFPTRGLPRTDLPLRAHEILEDALRDDLTGRDDYGSGSSLAAVRADVDATRAVLGFLADLLEPRAPGLLARADRQLGALERALDATRVGGAWVAAARVPLAARQRVDAAIGAVLETIAPVPDLLRTGNT